MHVKLLEKFLADSKHSMIASYYYCYGGPPLPACMKESDMEGGALCRSSKFPEMGIFASVSSVVCFATNSMYINSMYLNPLNLIFPFCRIELITTIMGDGKRIK